MSRRTDVGHGEHRRPSPVAPSENVLFDSNCTLCMIRIDQKRPLLSMSAAAAAAVDAVTLTALLQLLQLGQRASEVTLFHDSMP